MPANNIVKKATNKRLSSEEANSLAAINFLRSVSSDKLVEAMKQGKEYDANEPIFDKSEVAKQAERFLNKVTKNTEITANDLDTFFKANPYAGRVLGALISEEDQSLKYFGNSPAAHIKNILSQQTEPITKRDLATKFAALAYRGSVEKLGDDKDNNGKIEADEVDINFVTAAALLRHSFKIEMKLKPNDAVDISEKFLNENDTDKNERYNIEELSEALQKMIKLAPEKAKPLKPNENFNFSPESKKSREV